MGARKKAHRSTKAQVGVLAVGLVTAVACGDKGKDNKGGGPGGQGGAQLAQEVTANLSGAVGVLVLDTPTTGNSTGGTLRIRGVEVENASFRLEGEPSGEGQGQGGDGSLVKVGGDGEVSSVLEVKKQEGDKHQGGGFQQPLPRVKTIAVAPNKEIYLHFEFPFVYRKPEGNVDPHQQGSGYQCQIFKVKGGGVDVLMQKAPDAPNLECIDNQHFVDSWQANRNSVFQFDKDSNVYYPGSLPGGGKMVVYKHSADGTNTEVINANICVQDFLVTKTGGVFYTGTSSCDGGGNGDGGFFRYVSPDGSVREIARDWYNFVFEPVEGATGDQAVFFGPDPRSATTASWNSACLFNFDPAAGTSSADSIDDVITCGNDIQSWIDLRRAEDESYGRGFQQGEMNPSAQWKTEFKRRCESEGQVFAGGGSQISAIKQDTDGNVYVIGRVRVKKKGEIACNLHIKGAHCVRNGIPYDKATKDDCEDPGFGGQWNIADGNCSDPNIVERDACVTASEKWFYRVTDYNSTASELCATTSFNQDLWSTEVKDTVVGTYTASVASSDWWQCRAEGGQNNMGGDGWTDEYRSLAKVEEETKTLKVLSGINEQAVRLWLVKNVPFYATYNTQEGKYYLKKWDAQANKSVTLAENFEAYNMSESNEDGKLFYDGLDFSNNSYAFGTMLDHEPYERTQKTGLTGTVKTIVILPK